MKKVSDMIINWFGRIMKCSTINLRRFLKLHLSYGCHWSAQSNETERSTTLKEVHLHELTILALNV